MHSLELIFNRLGEEATIEITRQRDAKGFKANLQSSKDGGATAGEARVAYEKKIGKEVVTPENFLKALPKNTELIGISEADVAKIATAEKPKKD